MPKRRKEQGKEEMLRTRVTPAMKAAILALAQTRGETESLIVREALRDYLEKMGMLATGFLNEDATPPSFGKQKKKLAG